MTRRARLTVAHYVDGDQHTLLVGGELDLQTGPKLIDAVTSLLEEPVDHLTLDLGDLTFLDTSGLQYLRKVQRLCEEHGCRLVLTLVRPHIRQMFSVTGVDEVLPLGEEPTDR
jgi:anti-sigma B factor antagonist